MVDDRSAARAGPTPADSAMFRALIDGSSELVVVTDAVGTIRYASAAAAAALGYGAGEHVGRNVVELLHPDEIESAIESMAVITTQAGVQNSVELRVRRNDGLYRNFEIIATNLLDDPDVGGVVYHCRDLTERFEQQRRHRVLFEQSPIASAFLRFDQSISANHAFSTLVGHSLEELRLVRVSTLIEPVDFHRSRVEMARAFRSGADTVVNEHRWVRKDGTNFWGRTTARMLCDDQGRPESLFIAVIDITSERESRAALAESERRFRAIIDNSTDIIAVLEPGGYWTASEAGTRQLGYPKGFDPEGGVFSLVHPDDLAMAAEGLTEVLDGRRGPMDPILLRLRDAKGVFHFYECVGQNLGNEADVGGVVITARNIDRRHELEEQLARDATHDPLTGLLNRAAFMVAMDRAVARSTRQEQTLCIMFVDLDRFKQVNDTLGHAAGDAVLIEVARRIEACVRESDSVARLGGDEFVVLCEDLDTYERASEIAERIVAAVEQRIAIGDREAFVGASVGIAFAQEGQDGSEVLRDADAAVYRAKRGGRARVERFDDAMRADTTARVNLEVELRHALERDELSLEYDPVLNVATGTIEAFVVRPVWERVNGPTLRGGEIRALADDAGLGRSLGRRYFARIADDLATWNRDLLDGTSTRLFVSPTGRHLVDREFPRDLAIVSDRGSIAPNSLCIGVPEEWLVDASGSAVTRMQRLHEVGVRIALNGFGRSHSSLVDLRRLPLDVIRLDPRFAFGLAVDPAGVAIVNAVVGLARALDRRVLVDGVDAAEFLAAIFTLGCDLATGELLARPVDGARAGEILAQPVDFGAIA